MNLAELTKLPAADFSRGVRLSSMVEMTALGMLAWEERTRKRQAYHLKYRRRYASANYIECPLAREFDLNLGTDDDFVGYCNGGCGELIVADAVMTEGKHKFCSPCIKKLVERKMPPPISKEDIARRLERTIADNRAGANAPKEILPSLPKSLDATLKEKMGTAPTRTILEGFRKTAPKNRGRLVK